jgi:putative copper resistance protein D
MAPDLATVQRLVTFVLNLATAVLAGAALSRLWLHGAASGWAAARCALLRRAAFAAGVVALAADAGVLWLEAAAMAEVPAADAAGPAWAMLTSTHFGTAWSVGLLGLAGATTAAGFRWREGQRGALGALLSLAVFWATRSIVSHATADGDASLRVAADWLHLALVNAWVGQVIVGGVFVLAPSGNLGPDDRRARAGWVASLSGSATAAVAGIFVTGVYAAWRTLGSWADMVGNPYGNTLVAKVLLVGVAAMLGGFNRWAVMPHWIERESAGASAPAALPVRFRRILLAEALVLAGALVLAAWLASTPPPGEAMGSGQM